MRAATQGSLPPVMPQGNLVEVLGREVRQGSPGELMVESSPSRQRRPPCKTNNEMSDEAADAAALTYLLTSPQGRVFKWKVMPFGAHALFQELMNKILSILRRRPVVQELISRGAQMEAHIDNVCLGTNTQEGNLILLGVFFAVC